MKNINSSFAAASKRATKRYWDSSNGTKTTVTKTVMKNPKKTLAELTAEELRTQKVVNKAKAKSSKPKNQKAKAATKAKTMSKAKGKTKK